jgi:hypothetical protein
VNVTGWPNTEGFTEEATLVVEGTVAARATGGDAPRPAPVVAALADVSGPVRSIPSVAAAAIPDRRMAAALRRTPTPLSPDFVLAPIVAPLSASGPGADEAPPAQDQAYRVMLAGPVAGSGCRDALSPQTTLSLIPRGPPFGQRPSRCVAAGHPAAAQRETATQPPSGPGRIEPLAWNP